MGNTYEYVKSSTASTHHAPLDIIPTEPHRAYPDSTVRLHDPGFELALYPPSYPTSTAYSTSSESMRRQSLQLIHTLNARATKHARMVTVNASA